jgi:hypothetical protein
MHTKTVVHGIGILVLKLLGTVTTIVWVMQSKTVVLDKENQAFIASISLSKAIFLRINILCGNDDLLRLRRRLACCCVDPPRLHRLRRAISSFFA